MTHEELAKLYPCKNGLAYARSFSTLAEAWEKCERSDWMWWLLRRKNLTPKNLSIEYGKACAEHVAHLKTLSYWIAGYAAADAAADAAAENAAAAADAAAENAADAACAAAYAADAVAYAADAAYAAAYAAYAADAAYAAAAYAAADAAAYAAELAWQANLLRSLVPNPFLL